MPRFQTRSLARPLALIASGCMVTLLVGVSISARRAPSVAEIAARATARARWADCAQVALPTLTRASWVAAGGPSADPEDWATASDAWLPSTTAAGVRRNVGPTEAPYLASTDPQAPTTRMDVYELPDRASTVITATPSVARLAAADGGGDAACVRIIVTPAPPAVPVGVPKRGEGSDDATAGNSVVSMPKWAQLAYPEGGRKAASTYGPRNLANTILAIDPDTIKTEVRITVYKDGVAVPKQKVRVWMDVRGAPGVYGYTYAHPHVIREGSQPSFRLWKAGQLSPGERPVDVLTDEEGVAKVQLSPGYRGGPEALIVSTTIPGVGTIEGARSIIARHGGGFVDWSVATGRIPRGINGGVIPASNAYPYILTGFTARHPYNHFVRASYAASVAQMFREVWAKDPGRNASTTPRYLQLNDMSLEYGGLFKLYQGATCATSASSHRTHLGGIDFDVSPCYSEGREGQTRVGADACEGDLQGKMHLKLDEAVLASIVIGAYGGAIFEHHKIAYPGIESPDGAPYHYHIRFPDRPVVGNR